MKVHMRDSVPKADDRSTFGFSLLEVMVSLGVLLVILGIVFVFFTDYGKSLNSESSILETQVSARVALDEIARSVQQIGYNIDRTQMDNPALWQHDLIYAGSHGLVFNADLDTSRGPIDSTQTLTFPTGGSYVGEGSATTTGAETYVYTIDANADNSITTADRSAAATGSFNPAADTLNPMDFALFKRVYGWDGTGFGGGLVPISACLFTNATTDAKYPDTSSPNPLFKYWVTEDLDANGALSDSECVVGTCPPSTSRKPLLYLWGDTDFDGKLSESEKDNIRDKPVGSANWSKNSLASGGAYKSTNTTAAIDPTVSGSYVLKVGDASKMAVGAYVQIGTGVAAETNIVESIQTSSNSVILLADPKIAHASGTAVTILPWTLLRAVRSVQIEYDAITPKKDLEAGAGAPGMMGHAGTKGLDYRVRSFQKTVELVNVVTTPLIAPATNAPPACPLTIGGVCGGSGITQVTGLVPGSPVTLSFLVKDSVNVPKRGVPVDFTQSNPSIGGLPAIATVKTDVGGISSVTYSPSGLIGDSIVTAKGTCANASNQLVTYTSTITVKTAKVVISMTPDCLGTVGPSAPFQTASYTVQVQNSSGVIANAPISLQITFDPASLPGTPDYSKVEGELFVGGSSRGTTGSSGSTSVVTTDTGASGTLSGQISLNRDVDGTGARINLMVTPLGSSCWPAGTPVTKAVTFFKLALNSSYPSTGCTETSPCSITPGAQAPSVVATLSLKSLPQPNAGVTFSANDYQIFPGSPAGASKFVPAASATTDSSGQATVFVGNNGAASITAMNPLLTTVNATSAGPAADCSSGNISYAGLRPKFAFEGKALVGTCDADMQQAWVSMPDTSKKQQLCFHIQNPSQFRTCPMRPTALTFKIFKADNVNPDPLFTLNHIDGGSISNSPNCTTTGDVVLFDKACNLPTKANLANGAKWTFQNASGCVTPPSAAGAGQYFVLGNVKWGINVGGTARRIDVTVDFACEDTCSGDPPVSETFTLQAP